MLLIVSHLTGENRVPHITNAIQDWVQRVALVPTDDSGAQPDICVVELGEPHSANKSKSSQLMCFRWYRW